MTGFLIPAAWSQLIFCWNLLHCKNINFVPEKWFGLKFSSLNDILWTSNPLATWCEGPIRQHIFMPCKHIVKIQKFGRKHCIQILCEIIFACSLSHTQDCAKDTSKGPAGSPRVQSPPSKARKPQGDQSCHEAMGVYLCNGAASASQPLPSHYKSSSGREEVGAFT